MYIICYNILIDIGVPSAVAVLQPGHIWSSGKRTNIMSLSRYSQISTNDIPFEVFTLFSRSEQKTHASALLLIAAMAEEDLEGAVQKDVLLDAFARDIVWNGTDEKTDDEDEYGEGNGDEAVPPASREFNTLKRYNMVRIQTRYDQNERRFTDYVMLTGRGRKTVDFLVSVSQMDITETKEANIQSALFSMRAASANKAARDVLLYDALKAAHEGIADLIRHLASFSANFNDFIDANTRKIESAKQAREWIVTMFSSNFINEYFTIVETTFSYSAKLGEIRQIALKLQRNSKLTDRIISQEFERRIEIARKTNVEADRKSLVADVKFRIRRLYEMTDYEYHGYISNIQEHVTSIIKRTYYLLAAYGAGNDNNSIIMKLLKLVRYADCMCEDIPLSISNLYEYSAIDPESLRNRPAKNAATDIAPIEEPLLNSFSDEPVIKRNRKEEALAMARALIPEGGFAATDDLPCSNIGDYMNIFVLTGIADRIYNPAAEFDFTFENGTFEKGRFILPRGIYKRMPAIRKKTDKTAGSGDAG